MFKNPMLSNQVRPMHLLNPQEMKIYTQLQQQLYMGTLPPHCIQMYVYLDTKFNMMRFKPLEAFHPDVNVGNKVSVVNAPSNLTVSDTNPLVYVRRSTNTKPPDFSSHSRCRQTDKFCKEAQHLTGNQHESKHQQGGDSKINRGEYTSCLTILI